VEPHLAQMPDSFSRRRETGPLGELIRDVR
jgi:hypothetical protein